MEEYQVSRENALRAIKVADHMLTITYPLVQDTKLLLTVMENIFIGLSHSMAAVLHWERKYKQVPHFRDNFDSKYNTFKLYCMPRYNLSREYLPFLMEMKEIIAEHKASPVEFIRKNRFVIASEDYRLKSLSIEDVKANLAKAKLFIQEALSILEENERANTGFKGRA